MIDLDKVKAAFAANPNFCQNNFYKDGDGTNPAALCAVSALLRYAGVHPDLIGTMRDTLRTWAGFNGFATPVLKAYFGLPESVTLNIPKAFDDASNEWAGVDAVIKLCETSNEAERNRPAAFTSTAMLGKHYKPYGISSASFPAWDWVEPKAVSSKSIDYMFKSIYGSPLGGESLGLIPQTTKAVYGLTIPKAGDLLAAASHALGTQHVTHPSQHVLDALLKPATDAILTGLVSPAAQIIEHTTSLSTAAQAKPQKLLTGDVLEWKPAKMLALASSF